MIYAFVLFSALYVLLILVCLLAWRLKKETILQPFFEPNLSFSIVIAARNEEINLPRCLQSIFNQQYPTELFEVIVVDDFSIDNTALVAKQMGAKVVDMKKENPISAAAYKKNALHAGIQNAVGQLIITTDADCAAGPHWLQSWAEHYQKHQQAMIIGPVCFDEEAGYLNAFQRVDFSSMQAITAASHHLNWGSMCNGANLCFEKKSFQELGGYSGTTHVASGDDFLLLHKFKQAHKRVGYLKNKAAIITTPAQPSWSSLINQRIRWASKTGKYADWKLTFTLGFIYLYNCMLLIGLGLIILGKLWWLIGVVCFVFKILAETLLVRQMEIFLKQRNLIQWLWILQPFHVLYIIATGSLAWAGKYEWKGRQSVS